ncbi:MAG TPA: prephenate dehydratase [Alphaproteobacteria bacterium]|nr:prephenate dehydratase [Alphaproteobacteria bacterium]
MAFQGTAGANSDLACREVHPELATLPCPSFEDAFDAVRQGRARLAMIPVENSVNGRVADIHHLLPQGGLHIVGEHFQRVEHHLLVNPGVRLEELRFARSHVQALGQCRESLRGLGLTPVAASNTAVAAQELAASGARDTAAIASALAGRIYGLEVLRPNIEDHHGNTTRFLVMQREAQVPALGAGPVLTSFVFRVRSVPAALYKALGGFATNGVNIVKLESYLVDGHFTQAQFYAEVEGHPEERPLRLALEELNFFANPVTILGVYPVSPFRAQAGRG